MSELVDIDNVHRLVKAELDAGSSSSLAEAMAKFSGYRLGLEITPDAAADAYGQAALLSSVALARRVFLGGVTVCGTLDVPHRSPLPLGKMLSEAVAALGGQLGEVGDVPRIEIGASGRARSHDFHVRTVYGGWRGGVVPIEDLTLAGAAPMPLSPMLAAALAVSEGFSFVRKEDVPAGRRSIGLSLWRPSSDCDWLEHAAEPPLSLLPNRLWLLGLGHLGQAFLWALGLLPYPDPAQLQLALQDRDTITTSTESTSILSDASLVGQRKTRAMAAWAERRGFSTSIVERWFDGDARRQRDEPGIALCGLDNADGRRALDQTGFDFVVEAGLGRGAQDFRKMRMHTLPGPRTAGQIWKRHAVSTERPLGVAYQKMVERRELDRCGATLLEGMAVGAPFVGAVAACLAVSEVLRLLHGGPIFQVGELDLESIAQRTFVPSTTDFSALNPGFVTTGRS